MVRVGVELVQNERKLIDQLLPGQIDQIELVGRGIDVHRDEGLDDSLEGLVVDVVALDGEGGHGFQVALVDPVLLAVVEGAHHLQHGRTKGSIVGPLTQEALVLGLVFELDSNWLEGPPERKHLVLDQVVLVDAFHSQPDAHQVAEVLFGLGEFVS